MGKGQNKKAYKINFIHNGKDAKSVLREIAKNEIQKILVENQISLYNLDEIVSEYVSGDMCNENTKHNT